MKRVSPWHVGKELLYTDLRIFRYLLPDRLINLCIWVSTNVLINAYLMPAFGLSQNYAPFILAGTCASAGLFEIFPSVVSLVSDFEGDQIVSYYATLPLPGWMLWLRSILYYAISATALALAVLPLGQLLLWHEFNIAAMHLGKLAIMLVMAHLFYGAFVLWIASRVKNMTKISNVWMRFVYPLWFLGGFQFSWLVLHDKIPVLAYLNLINPLTYIMEGFRGAILGGQSYLPFALCVGMLGLYSSIFAWHGIYRLRKRLDFI